MPDDVRKCYESRQPRHLKWMSVVTLLSGILCVYPSSGAGPKVGVFMRGYDTARTGSNAFEAELKPDSVKQRGLTKLFSVPQNERLDDLRIEAQPLIVPDISVGGTSHDVLY